MLFPRISASAVLLATVIAVMPPSEAQAAHNGSPPGSATASAAKGNPKAYALMSKNPVARWNPCAVIGYRVNLSKAPKGALADVKGAIKRVSDASGLKFSYKGTTSAFPAANAGYSDNYPKGTDLVIAWVTPGKQSSWMPRNGPAGVGGPSWTSAYTSKGGEGARIVWGGVVLNASLGLEGGFGSGPEYGWQGTRGQLLMHEIGHAVGLDHPSIDQVHQIMAPSMSRKPAVWGAGDLTGLRLVGSRGGCLYNDNPTTAAVRSVGRTPVVIGAFARS